MEIRIGNRRPGNTPPRRLSHAPDGERRMPPDFELPAATALGVFHVLLGLLFCGAMVFGFSGGRDLLKRLLIGGLVAAVAVLPTLRPLDLAHLTFRR